MSKILLHYNFIVIFIVMCDFFWLFFGFHKYVHWFTLLSCSSDRKPNSETTKNKILILSFRIGYLIRWTRYYRSGFSRRPQKFAEISWLIWRFKLTLRFRQIFVAFLKNLTSKKLCNLLLQFDDFFLQFSNNLRKPFLCVSGLS